MAFFKMFYEMLGEVSQNESKVVSLASKRTLAVCEPSSDGELSWNQRKVCASQSGSDMEGFDPAQVIPLIPSDATFRNKRYDAVQMMTKFLF
jgi:hypothetical protein